MVEMNSRRAMLIFKHTSMANKEFTHDDAVKLVWRFLNKRETQIQHHFVEKPYVWHIVPNGDNFFSLVFSSIFPEITKDFYEEAKSMENGVVEVNSSMVTVISVNPIADLDYIGEYLRISSYNLVCQKNVRHKKTSVNATEKEDFCAAIVSRLVRRAKVFLNLDISEEDIQVKFPKQLSFGTKKYKDGLIPVQDVEMKLVAPKEIIELALYSGVGSKSGSGFGTVYSA